jgi:hypothetical protein
MEVPVDLIVGSVVTVNITLADAFGNPVAADRADNSKLVVYGTHGSTGRTDAAVKLAQDACFQCLCTATDCQHNGAASCLVIHMCRLLLLMLLLLSAQVLTRERLQRSCRQAGLRIPLALLLPTSH